MLSPRGQAVLEAKILSSASAPKICPRPQTRPRAFVLGLSSNFLFWPHENVCNAGIGNFDSIYYQHVHVQRCDWNYFLMIDDDDDK